MTAASEGKKRSHAGLFKKGDPRTKEVAKKGGQAYAAKTRTLNGPYPGTMIDFLDAIGLTGPSWAAWRVFWKGVFALPMTEEELVIFRRHTERETPPSEPVKEAWMPIGRRGGKSRNAAAGAAFLAVRFDASVLAKGETAVIPIIAADKKQARQVMGYLRGFFETDELRGYLHRVLKESIELHCGVNIEVHTANFRSIRGYTVVGAICDEIAFWRTDDGSANPDSEVLNAMRPGMATIPSALLLGLSNPYAARGELYRAYERSFGKEDPHTLVWNADSRSMNSRLSGHVVERAFEEDPLSAASEYGSDGRVSFRRDVDSPFSPDVVRAVTIEGRFELPPTAGISYQAFVDASGGSQDSMTLGIGHRSGDRAVLDAVREVRPPFSPDQVVKEFAELLRAYRIGEVTGDRYAGEWPRERFQVHGIRYRISERTKSEIYSESIPIFNSGRVEILDIPVLRAQIIGLERKVARGGKGSIDHQAGGRDDVANAALGVLVLIQGVTSGAVPQFYAGISYIDGADYLLQGGGQW